MQLSKTGNVWHSPYNTFKHLEELYEKFGKQKVESSGKFKVVREARTAAVVALLLNKFSGEPAYIQLPKQDPPDAFVMQSSIDKIGTLNITTLEITTYRSNGESLLEQLKRTKLSKKSAYNDEYVLIVELMSKEKIDYEAVRNYANQIKIHFPIWTISPIMIDGTTTVELVIFNPITATYQIPIGDALANCHKNGFIDVITTKRVGSEKKVRTEKQSDDVNISPWEHIADL